MMPGCQAPIPEGTLLDYWARDLAAGDEDRVEAHLFACGDCSARLHRLAALGPGLATLVGQGRVSGIVSRALLNRMQRDGIHVRMYLARAGRDRAVCRLSRRQSRRRRPASRLLRSGCRDTVGDGARRLAKRRESTTYPCPGRTPRCSGPRLPPSCVRCHPCGCSLRSCPPAPRASNSAGTCSTTQRRRYPCDHPVPSQARGWTGPDQGRRVQRSPVTGFTGVSFRRGNSGNVRSE